VLATYPGAPPVTHLGHLLGWSPPPLTVRDARRWAARQNPELPAGGAREAADRRHSTPGESLVRGQGLVLRHGRNPVLDDVSVTVAAGQSLAVLGRNGSGKTTLLRALAGLHEPERGTVVRDGSVAYVPQDPNALLFAPTVRAELAETLRLRRRRDDGRIDAWLDRLGLLGLAERHPRSLSAGQRQRVAIAAVAVGGASVLLLDEPTRGIDAPSARALCVALHEHVAAGGAVVLATHDTELAAELADTVMVLGDGSVVAEGAAHEVLAGSLFAPQVLRVLPPYLTVEEVRRGLCAVADAGGSIVQAAAPLTGSTGEWR
jgi:energy-coupling factor transport system ATP-binding protein